MRVRPIIMCLLSLSLLNACAQQPEAPSVQFNDVTVTVEVANTYETLQRGLMFRTNLSKNSGMLFVFPDEAPRIFWMKNTLIPLDMIHIAQNGTVVDIITATPCAKDPCPTYPSSNAAKYILEVDAGFAARHNIKKGEFAVINE